MTDTLVPDDTPPSARPVRSAPSRRRWSWTFVGLTSLAVAGWFGGQHVEGLFIVHIVTAAVALAVGPFQFSMRRRRRSIRAHRTIGRVYLIAVLFGATSGAVTTLWNSMGIRGVFGYFMLDVLWAATTWLGFRAVRGRRFREHQAWMIRSFALTYAAVTLRAALPVLVLLQLPFSPDTSLTELVDNAIHTIAPWLGWLITIVVAEWLIARRGLPGVRWSTFREDRRSVSVTEYLQSSG